jgi:hypothetical protein
MSALAELEYLVISTVVIDDLRIYNRALSAPEVQAIYNAEK